MTRDQDIDNQSNEDKSGVHMFGSDEEVGTQIPTQAQSVVEGSGAVMVSEFRPAADVDYLQVCGYSSVWILYIPSLFLLVILFRYLLCERMWSYGIHDSFVYQNIF